MEKYQIRFLESEKEIFICNGPQIFSQERDSEHGKRGRRKVRQESHTYKHTPFTLLLLSGTKKGAAGCLQQFVLFISAPFSVPYLHLDNFFFLGCDSVRVDLGGGVVGRCQLIKCAACYVHFMSAVLTFFC